MALGVRHGVGALAVAFIVGTVAGAAGMLGGDDPGPGATAIQFRPESEESTQAPPRKKAPKKAFTTEAVREKSGRIILSGVARGVKPGSRLTVQRKQGSGWSDFPAGTTVDPDGSYSLWIKTSRSGAFRMKDERSGATSQPVDVRA